MKPTPSKILLIILAFVFFQVGYTQSPTTYFDDNNPNIKYLEHLIKKGVDEVRENLGLKPLVNDSILYLAAGDQAGYLKKLRRLTHYQSSDPSKRTPQLRAEFYGAKNYNVGENVASTTYGTTTTMSTGEDISTKSYGGIANAIVTSWVNSPGHYQNIITKEYEVTGLSVSLDKKKQTIYACQNFAHVELQFLFEENKEMFPYSNYTPPPQVTSFAEVPNQLIPKYKYPFKLRHDKLEKCGRSPNRFTQYPEMSLEYDKYKGFTIRIENSEYVKDLIRHSHDGFAIEIVDYEDFACGSPFYYEKPSRRNGQLRLSGKTLEPKYRKDLFKGFKKRKKMENIKFFPYIFRKDSINFFRRFGQYKMDKYSSEYFEIRLGKIPRHGPRLFEANLVIIQDKQICDIVYFSPYCGAPYEEYVPTDFINYQYDDFQYYFKVTPDQLSFSIPFEQGQVNFEKKSILKNISSLSEFDFFIDSVNIHAFSSVEGDSAINAQLQIKRAENIASIFQGIQDQEITKTLSTSINWKDFRVGIARNRDTRMLTRLSNKDLLTVVNRNSKTLEPQLAATRRGDVKVFFHVVPNLKSLKYYINKEWIRLNSQIRFKSGKREDYEEELDQLADLYKYTYAMVKEGHLDSSYFIKLKLPKEIKENPTLVQLYLLFGFEYPTIFQQFRDWKEDSVTYLNQYCFDTRTKLIPEFNYLLIKLLSDKLIKMKSMTKKEYGTLIYKSKMAKGYYFKTELARINMDKINFNLNMLTLNNFYNVDPRKYKDDAVMAISQVYEYYAKNDLISDSLALKLARMAIFFRSPQLAIRFVSPYEATHLKIRTFIDEVGYVHPSEPYGPSYYQKLMNDSQVLPVDIWCNMFIKPCGIPFQIFDYEPLRKRYCELCKGKNDYLNMLLFGEK